MSYVSVGDPDGQPLPMFLKLIAQIFEDSPVPPDLNPLQIIEFYIVKLILLRIILTNLEKEPEY